MDGRPLIPLDKDTIVLLYQADMTSCDIATLFGVSSVTIIRRLHRWHIALIKRVVWNKGLTVDSDPRVRLNSEKTSRMAGHKHSDETRAKMSASRKGQNTWSRGRKLTPEHRAKIGEASRRQWQDPEYRARMIKASKARWADPNYANRVRPLLIKGNFKRPTHPEQILLDIIEKYNLPFKYTGDGSFIIQGFNPDFVNSNGTKVVIEIFGDYWHGKASRTWKETELGRIMAFNSFGFHCIIFWERELNTLPQQAIVERIKRETRRLSSLHVSRIKR